MKILALHTDYIKFKPLKKALKSIGDLTEKEKGGGEMENALAIFTAVEKGDSDIVKVVDELVKSIGDIAKQVNTKNIVLYPYAHLSSDLANPELAVNVLDEAEKVLKKDFNLVRAPFGYYKEYEMKVKGHPLSELSREIRIAGNEEEEKYNPVKLLREISKAKLDTSKLKPNDHRIIGKQMDLFSFNDVAPGMVFWHNNGYVIYNELVNYWKTVHRQRGYEIIQTPQIMDAKLWKVSGHWDKYKANNFVTLYEKRPFLVKPMNCPGGMLVFKSNSKSYRDLPLRTGEVGVVHRTELSGVLAGLFRVIQFTQDDAHIFCADKKQVEDEVIGVISLINEFYELFGLRFDHVELSTRPEVRIGNDKQWDMAEEILEKVLKKLKMKYKINKGDGAFYGPKIDFHVKDSLNRTWQLSTVQLDFALPERFELEYTDKNNKKKRPIMLHRVIYGSVERFVGILLEHTNGRLPTWLAPIQAKVLSFTDRNQKYGEEVLRQVKEALPELRIDTDFSQRTVPAKVKDAEIMRIPYILVVGDREEKEGKVAVRIKGNSKIETMLVDEFIDKIRNDIYEKA